jgi:hypothetical protein
VSTLSARGRTLLIGLCLLGLFVLSALMFTYLAWPLLLWPFEAVLLRSPLAGLLGLIPCLFSRAKTAAGRPSTPRWGLSHWLDGLFLGANLGAALVLIQILMIKMKTYLTLDQYLREQVYVLWIALFVLGAAYGLLLHGWARMRGRDRS